MNKLQELLETQDADAKAHPTVARMCAMTLQINQIFAHHLGERMTHNGQLWQIDGFNDQGVAYAVKVKRNKPLKTRFLAYWFEPHRTD